MDCRRPVAIRSLPGDVQDPGSQYLVDWPPRSANPYPYLHLESTIDLVEAVLVTAAGCLAIALCSCTGWSH